MDSYKIEAFENKGKPTMLFSAPYEFFPDNLKDHLKKNYQITFAFNAPYDKAMELLKQGVEIWITGTCPPYFVDDALIKASPELKIIATPSTGTNHLDIQYAQETGIKVLSIKDSPVIENIHASSEFSFALLLAMIKKIPFASHSAKQGTWREKEHEFRNIELNGKTMGLIGYGRIGKKMAKYASAFGMQVLAYDPYKTIKDQYVKQTDRDNLISSSVIVSLHYHLTNETKRSFTERDFNKMKDNSYFLNTARGELVDETAMINALRSGKLKAAAVDVISNEHIQDKYNHLLIKYARENENLIVTPHIAGCTVDSESRAAGDIIRQIENYLL